jgi:hypothetical protein
MADKEQHIENNSINGEHIKIDIEVRDESTLNKKYSRKKGDTEDTYECDVSTDMPISDETPKTTFKRKNKSTNTEIPSEMLTKFDTRQVTEPPIMVPRVKKVARKKAVKVNTKTINRIVRFF